MNPHDQPAAEAGATRSDSVATAGLRPLPALIGSTRYIALLGVGAVLLIAMYLFALAAGLAGVIVWQTSWDVVRGTLDVASLKVEFLKIVTLLLEAVAFYIIGIGLHSLFIGPLPFQAGLQVNSLSDLESKIVSVIIVILALTFLEEFTRGQPAEDTLLFGVAVAVVVLAMVAFQYHIGRDKSSAPSSAAPPSAANRDEQ